MIVLQQVFKTDCDSPFWGAVPPLSLSLGYELQVVVALGKGVGSRRRRAALNVPPTPRLCSTFLRLVLDRSTNTSRIMSSGEMSFIHSHMWNCHEKVCVAAPGLCKGTGSCRGTKLFQSVW